MIAVAAGLALGCSTGELEPAQSANEVTPGMALSSVGPVQTTRLSTATTASGGTPTLNEAQSSCRPRLVTLGLPSRPCGHTHCFRPSSTSGASPRAFGTVYQDVEVRPPAWMQNLRYYDHLYDNFIAELPLPTPDMRAMALPEARVGAQGVLSGYVYFEHVPRSVGLVTLRVDVLDAETGQELGTAAIPFNVD